MQYIKGVGPARKKLFANLGVSTVEDLLYLFPRRYEDRTSLTPIAQAQLGQYQVVRGRVIVQAGRKTWYTHKHVQEVIIDDGTGRMFCVWFNQPYLTAYFKTGREVIFYGKVDVYKNRLQMVSPEYEFLEEGEENNLSVGRIVPIYPLTRGMGQRYLRKVIFYALEHHVDELRDILPVALRNQHRIVNIKRSIKNIHFPETQELQESAIWRISFEEFFLFQIAVRKRRMSIIQKEGVAHEINAEMIEKFSQLFSFALTGAQKRCISEMASDMQKKTPMLRLLQGDVGAGKTIVAFWGCVVAFLNGKQSAIMAPTGILAQQHYEKIQNFLKSRWLKKMRVALLTSNITSKEREKVYADIKSGKVDLVIGTHALLNETLNFVNLSYVVIDEQHKFGVRQRAILSAKGQNPDCLVMTATPIPRTLNITLYGDLDVSILDEMPRNRGKIMTKWYPLEEAGMVYENVKKLVEKGEQAYIVYPLIEESEKVDLKAAQKMFKHLQKNEFKGLSMGMIHGQMKKEDALKVMQKFQKGQLQILVATSILEVGIDVPQANVIVIEHADRFGLSQLHQLRGRVGRGIKDAHCFLIANPVTEESQRRVETLCATTDGFKIAEQDLLIRGPGHYFGRHQHGLSELRFANPLTQMDILELARTEALGLIHQDPELKEESHRVLKEVIEQRYPTYLAMTAAA
ncbi:MAG: ATP-dependent DNA helicase RecG [Candidatus Omnitrophica bacterium]|nr:ATP-dependent DNA helicase RecG [Candidatus Omnitrophota bacterium]